jgi:hypothetical protein
LPKNNVLKGTTNFGMINGTIGSSKIGKDGLKQERRF